MLERVRQVEPIMAWISPVSRSSLSDLPLLFGLMLSGFNSGMTEGLP
jgi:hypothetical protein